MQEKLTAKQERVLNFIKQYRLASGYPPTIREVADKLGLAGPNSAKKFLDILERKGFVRRKPGSSRAIELLDEKKGSLMRMVPVVGTIRAGAPFLAEEHIEERIAVDSSLARSDDMFFLKVKGDSMINAHIVDGDLALIRPQKAVEQGAIAAVLIGDEATLKYFFRSSRGIRLEPANPAAKPVLIEEEKEAVTVIGKVVGILRAMKK